MKNYKLLERTTVLLFQLFVILMCLWLLISLKIPKSDSSRTEIVINFSTMLLGSVITILFGYSIFKLEGSRIEKEEKKMSKKLINNFLSELNANADRLRGYCDLYKEFIKDNYQLIIKKIDLTTVPNTSDLISFNLNEINYVKKNQSIIDTLKEYLSNNRSQLSETDYMIPKLPFFLMEQTVTEKYIKETDMSDIDFLNSLYEIMKINNLFKFQINQMTSMLKEYLNLKDKNLNESQKILMHLFLHHQIHILSYINEYSNHMNQIVTSLLYNKRITGEEIHTNFSYLDLFLQKIN